MVSVYSLEVTTSRPSSKSYDRMPLRTQDPCDRDQWLIYGGAIGAIAPPPRDGLGAAFWAPRVLKIPPPNVQKIFCDCRRRFEGGILSACCAENAAPQTYKKCLRLPKAVWGRHLERLQRRKCRPTSVDGSRTFYYCWNAYRLGWIGSVLGLICWAWYCHNASVYRQ